MKEKFPQNTIHQLGNVFQLVDDEILSNSLEGWPSPIVVVMGSTHSGKSAFVERLGMVKYCEDEAGSSPPVHVRMRNRTETVTWISLLNTCTNKSEYGPQTFKDFDARAQLHEILTHMQKSKANEVSAERIILITLEGPHFPNIDLVDTPGLQATSPFREQSRSLLQRYIESYRKRAWFLAMVPATERPSNTLVMEVIQSNNLESRTLGVFTNVDKITSDQHDHLRSLVMQQPSAQKLGMVRLEPFGWHATMSAPLNSQVPGLEGWCHRTSAENDFFVGKFSDLVEAGKAGCTSLIDVLKTEYFNYLKECWAALVIRSLCAGHAKAQDSNAKLGLPVFDPASRESETEARLNASKIAAKALRASVNPNLNQKLSSLVLEPLKKALIQVLPIEKTVAFEMFFETMVSLGESVREAIVQAAFAWCNVCVEHAAEGLKASASQLPFRLDRFPVFCKMMEAKLKIAFSQKRDSIVSTTDSITTSELNALNPGCATSVRFEVNQEDATVSIKCDVEELVNRILVFFIMPGSVLIEVADNSASFAEELKPDGWVEACHDQRKFEQVRMAQMLYAKAKVMKALGVRDGIDEVFRMRGVDPFGCDDHNRAFELQPSEADKKITQDVSGNPFKCLVHHPESGHVWVKSIPWPTKCGPQLRPHPSANAYFFGQAIDWDLPIFFLRGVCVRGCDDDVSALVISRDKLHTKVKELIEGHPLKCAVYFESTGKLHIKTIALNNGGLALQQCDGAMTFLNGEPWKPAT